MTISAFTSASTSASNSSRPLTATIRLQFHRDYGFDDALAQLDYYSGLGVSHLYASPIFAARSGSTHGYDVVDPRRVNPELGGEEGLRRLVDALHARKMGLIVDIVPNHMAVGEQNPWWCDVLLWGQHSRYANWFDIDWLAADPDLHGKVLLPVLGKAYGESLRDGDIRLCFDAPSARLQIEIPGHRLPVAPEDYLDILSAANSARLQPVIVAFRQLLDAAVQEERQSLAALAWQALADAAAAPGGVADIDAALAAYSASTPVSTAASTAALHALLERQHFRLCDWRNAGDEINWRRFFEIGDLIGMRVEQEEVFEALHAALFRLYGDGLIDGVRIDHIDGLADPEAYVQRLRTRLQALRPDVTPYIVAEKILAGDESLPTSWGLDGTSGYDFMDQAGGVLHDAAGAPVLDAIWKEYRADPDGFDHIVLATRKRLLSQNFASEFNALTSALHALGRCTIATRDISLMSIRRCMLELLAYFPVYRTYGNRDGCDSRDASLIRTTAARIRGSLRKSDQATLDVLASWLADSPESPQSDMHDQRHAQLHWRALTRFQQLTPPLTAKSSEDTAFYRYGRLLSRNEVGAEPARLAWSVGEFHHHVLRRQRDFPLSMLATATHDHKRGEDARMRLAVLSEIPQHWQQTLQRWRVLNQSARRQTPIDAVDELMLYQTLIGVWPLILTSPSTSASAHEAAMPRTQLTQLTQLIQRVSAWQCKALREAKRRSDWSAPDLAYEASCEGFLRSILRPDADNLFLPALRAFVEEIAAAGALNSLSQTVLRMTAPGIPDLYQGCDLWDFSLVDPDNRRPVDYGLRMELMAQGQLQQLTLDGWRSGTCKQQLIRALLLLRRGREALMTEGAYVPLTVQGELAEHVLAFARSSSTVTIVVLCSRHAAKLSTPNLNMQNVSTSASQLPQLLQPQTRPPLTPLIEPQRWRDTAVQLPQEWPAGEWQSVLSGRQGAIRPQGIVVSEVLQHFPVDVLVLSR